MTEEPDYGDESVNPEDKVILDPPDVETQDNGEEGDLSDLDD